VTVAPPQELIGEFVGYNLIRYGDTYFGVLQGIVGLEPDRFDADGYDDGAVLRADSIGELQKAITLFKKRFGVPSAFRNVQTTTPLDELGLPEVIEVEPMEKCNLRCFMCPQNYDEASIGHARVTPTFYKNLKGLDGKLIVMGANNEPTTHPQFTEIAKGLSDIGMKIDLTTNGTMLSEKTIAGLADCNFSNVIFSFDGMRKETFESIRINASYERTLERILDFRQALSNSDVFFSIQYILMKRTLPELIEALDYWEANEFDHMGLLGLIVGRQTPLLMAERLEPLLPEVYRAVDEAVERVITRDFKMTLSTSFRPRTKLRKRYPDNFVGDTIRSGNTTARLPFNARTFFQNGAFPGMHVDCRSAFKYARIYFDGTVRLCAQFAIGNIYERDFVDIWYGEEAHRVRAMLMRGPEACHQCDYYKHCLSAGTNDHEIARNQFFGEALGTDYKPEEVHVGERAKVIAWRGRYFGIPLYYGDYDVRMFDATQDREVVVANSLDEVTKLMKDRAGQLDPSTDTAEVLVRDGRYFAVPRFYGEYDLNTYDPERDQEVIVASSMDALKVELGRRANQFDPSTEHAVVVALAGLYFAVPRYYGDYDVSTYDPERDAGVIVAASLDELKHEMAHRVDQLDPSTENAAILVRGGLYFAVPRYYGDYDVSAYDGERDPDVIVAASLDELEREMARRADLVDPLTEHASIVAHGGQYFAVPRYYGEYHVDNYDSERDPEVIVATSLKALKREMGRDPNRFEPITQGLGFARIDGAYVAALPPWTTEAEAPRADSLAALKIAVHDWINTFGAPESRGHAVIVDSYHGFNILRHDARLYAVDQLLTDFNVAGLVEGRYGPEQVMAADDLTSIRAAIDAVHAPVSAQRSSVP
jgi:radical SAM protein with 4Fe4S-binding SPASM domain